MSVSATATFAVRKHNAVINATAVNLIFPPFCAQCAVALFKHRQK
jgi:hypothetical protein